MMSTPHAPIAKPFLKWAGGKSQLLPEIRQYYPFRQDPSITKYAEPFVGGGAVLFDILNHFTLESVYISDLNAELINTYITIRDQLSKLLSFLHPLADAYLKLPLSERKPFYLQQRRRFNELKLAGQHPAESAALLIFLNRTCFNGLYRVNRHGEFNVPIGAYKSPKICDEPNLHAVSKKLHDVQIICADYHQSADFIDSHTFVYFDPPYRPLTPTANFTAYASQDFTDQDQLMLAKFVQLLDTKGARIVISNSDPQNIDPSDRFFDDAYASQTIHRVEATRMINRNAAARGKIKELLITNF